MKDNLPPIITDWISNMHNKNNSEAIRYNYFTMLENVKKEVTIETAKFDTLFAAKTKKMVTGNKK